MTKPLDDNSAGDVIAAYPGGTIVLDDGITTHNSLRALRYRKANIEAMLRDMKAELKIIQDAIAALEKK
jgi:uncharacterized protein YijF (DUF1287 family)